MKFLRCQIRTLLVLTLLVAVVLAAQAPFQPTITLQSLDAVPVEAPYDFGGRMNQFRIVVRNDGYLPIWLDPGEITVPETSSGMNPRLGHPAIVDVDIFNDVCTKLSPGDSRSYILVVLKEYDRFRLLVVARDWRGREGNSFLGFLQNSPLKHP